MIEINGNKVVGSTETIEKLKRYLQKSSPASLSYVPYAPTEREKQQQLLKELTEKIKDRKDIDFLKKEQQKLLEKVISEEEQKFKLQEQIIQKEDQALIDKGYITQEESTEKKIKRKQRARTELTDIVKETEKNYKIDRQIASDMVDLKDISEVKEAEEIYPSTSTIKMDILKKPSESKSSQHIENLKSIYDEMITTTQYKDKLVEVPRQQELIKMTKEIKKAKQDIFESLGI